MSTKNLSCRLCGEKSLQLLLELGNHPIAHRFLTRPEDPEYTHDLTLLSCSKCGFIQINDPIPPDELYTHYNWLSSWKPQPHVNRLLEIIKKSTNLNAASRLVEVGSNDGSFLQVLKEKGFQNLLGIEPAKDADQAARKKGLRTINDYFDTKMAEKIVKEEGPYDLFIARQVFEHIMPLSEFKTAIQTILVPNGYILIEVPDFDFCLDALDYSAIWEEHVNYFTRETLESYLNQAGLNLLHAETALFSGQALIVLAQRQSKIDSARVKPMSALLKAKIQAYGARWQTLPTEVARYLQNHKSKGGQVAVYGAGCRASGLVNFAKLAPYIDFFLDDQPEKQGKYMPGSRKPILAGSELEKRPVTLCLLAVNAENEQKILDKHTGYKGVFASLHPPSDRLISPLVSH